MNANIKYLLGNFFSQIHSKIEEKITEVIDIDEIRAKLSAN